MTTMGEGEPENERMSERERAKEGGERKRILRDIELKNEKKKKGI